MSRAAALCAASFLGLSLLLTGCEHVADADDIPYVERIVVRGNLNVGKQVDSIAITRTLPLTVSYTPEAAAITDADATIEVGGASYPMTHKGNGYYAVPGLVVQPGNSYRLKVAWKGKTVSATTLAPTPVAIDSVTIERIQSNEEWLAESVIPTAIFRPLGSQVYLLSYDVNQENTTREFNIRRDQRIVRQSDTAADGRIRLPGNAERWYYYSPDPAPDPLTTVVVHLHGYDYPFYPYYQTQRSGDFDGDLFGFSGGNSIQWNVQGDGFGMFIATWTVTRTIPIQ